jgi:enoyl-CoA hydratase
MLLVEKPLDGVAVVTLNRPEAMNALSRRCARRCSQAIVELDADPSVR